MANLERLTITMSADMAATLRATVEGGEYASTSEIIREAVREWTRARDQDRLALEELRAAIRAGDESGEGIPAEQVYAHLRQVINEKIAENK